MKLAIVTPTCRPDPRLAMVARCIAASTLQAAAGHTVVWIIVDEKDRSTAQLLGIADVTGDHVVARALYSERLDVHVISPLANPYRAQCLPAHNSARNAGLVEAAKLGADYVMLLNDCNVVTPAFVSVALDCAAAGVGWSCKPRREVFDLNVPEDGILHANDHHDLLRPLVKAMLAPRAAWGAPMSFFVRAHGFDMAYDGQRGGNDIECAIRMERLGLRYVVTERAFTVQVRRTKHAADVTTNREAQAGATNKQRLKKLLNNRDQILPERGIDFAGGVPVDFALQFVEREGAEPAEPDQGDAAEAGQSAGAQSQSPVAAELVRQTGRARPAPARTARARDDAPKAVDTAPKSSCCKKPLQQAVLRGVPMIQCTRCRKMYPIVNADGAEAPAAPAADPKEWTAPVEKPLGMKPSKPAPVAKPSPTQAAPAPTAEPTAPAGKADSDGVVREKQTITKDDVADVGEVILTESESALADEFDTGGA